VGLTFSDFVCVALGLACVACHSTAASSDDAFATQNAPAMTAVQSPVPPDAPCATPPGTTVRLFTGGAWSFAIDDSFVYVNTDAAFAKAPLAGGAPTALGSFDGDAFGGFAIGAGALLFPTSAMTLGSIPLSGDSTAPPTFSGGGTTPFAYDGAAIYTAHEAPGHAVVARIPVDGSPPTTPTLPDGTIAQAIAASGDSLFVAVKVSVPGGYDGSLMKWTAATGELTTIASGIGQPFAMTVDDAFVYFIGVHAADAATADVRRVAFDGSSATTLATLPSPFTTTLAVDAHAVYFTSGVSIAKVDKSGGNVEKLATFGQGQPKIVVRGGNVYWGAPELSDANGTSVPAGVWTTCK
jgi:hypothetical protein